MSAEPNQGAIGSAAEPLKLWIHKDWYIPVDAGGYCIGESAEGALGFVIKLICSSQPDYATALKIPRLMGDTHRENAYTCELMEQELKTVQFVETYRTNVPKLNLLGVANATTLLRGEISTVPGDEEGAAWDRSVVLVSFEKGKRPRFCLARYDGGELRFWPPEVAPISLADYQEIEQRSRRWSQTVFVENSAGGDRAAIFATANAFSRRSIGETWYVGLPSVNYNWAPGTLQEAISLVRTDADGQVQSLRGSWSVKQHLQLAEQICRALHTLHARRMLHADLRPANIVFQAGAEHPSSYQVSDYGSFAQTAPKILARSHDGVGYTMGPVMVGERASAFYAPERRLGREREASDTAVICPVLDRRPCLKIVLGWRSDLIDEAGQPRMERIRAYIEQAASPAGELPDKILREGDRLQLREHIFELIEDEKRIGDKQILTCDYDYWQIYHGRVAVRVPASDEPHGVEWFPIPRTIELMKWSVATDLYSLGALLLYSIFRNRLEQGDNGSEIEDQFREMLAYLNSEPYFNAVWPELDWLRHCMEDALMLTRSADEFSRLAFTRYDRHITDQRNAKEPTNLLEAAEELTNRLAQTAPGIKRIVEGLEYNLAAFVFITHFALCCLHRQSHFTEAPGERRNKARRPEWKQELPFCKHRREAPEESDATPRALERLALLQGLVERGELQAMRPQDLRKIGSFDPRPDVSIRIERDQFERQIEDELKPEIRHLQSERHEVAAARDRIEQYATDLSQQLERYKERTRAMERALLEARALLGERGRPFEGARVARARELLRQAGAALGAGESPLAPRLDSPEVPHHDLP
ncbi:MAG TPA: hypothetical protein PKD53_18590 [Chloroflexaceae bacterium]|nr:hypothetical protein [Chloroflexaceae bacterium]